MKTIPIPPSLRLSLSLLLSFSGAASAKPVVQATNYPVAYFAQRIAGDRIDLKYLPSKEGDPAFWEPSDADLAALQSADLILVNGATYERWRAHASVPEELVVETAAGFASQFIEIKDATTHSHGKEGPHSHNGTAFTTWIDFDQARQQADATLKALQRLLPKDTAALETAAKALFTDLDQLDRDTAAAAKSIGNQPLIASHPVYHYLARRYALNIRFVLWEPDIVPDEAAMKTFQDLHATHPASWMIWEGTPAAESVTKLDALGVKSVVFDPCGNWPDHGDWLSVMRENVANLRKIGG